MQIGPGSPGPISLVGAKGPAPVTKERCGSSHKHIGASAKSKRAFTLANKLHFLTVRSLDTPVGRANMDSRGRPVFADNSPRTARTEVSQRTVSTKFERSCNSAPRQRRCSLGKMEGHYLAFGQILE